MDALEPALACLRPGGAVAAPGPRRAGALARPAGHARGARANRPRLGVRAAQRSLVRGEWHREAVAAAFDLPAEAFDVLPASIPMAPLPFQPQLGEPREILALMRLAPDKAAIAQFAVELTRARLVAGRPCRLTVAGEGPWREQAQALCEERLPAAAWRIEGAPADPVARLFSSDLVVAQGLTTLEAAALGRRVVVARAIDEDRAAGVVLTPDNYDVAARDPFGEPPLSYPRELLE